MKTRRYFWIILEIVLVVALSCAAIRAFSASFAYDHFIDWISDVYRASNTTIFLELVLILSLIGVSLIVAAGWKGGVKVIAPILFLFYSPSILAFSQKKWFVFSGGEPSWETSMTLAEMLSLSVFLVIGCLFLYYIATFRETRVDFIERGIEETEADQVQVKSYRFFMSIVLIALVSVLLISIPAYGLSYALREAVNDIPIVVLAIGLWSCFTVLGLLYFVLNRADVKRLAEAGLPDHKWQKLSPVIMENREVNLLQGSRKMAEHFLLNSSPFEIDNVDNSLVLLNTLKIKPPYCWAFEFSFISWHNVYDDNNRKIIGRVKKSHQAKIVVDMGEIRAVLIDNVLLKDLPRYSGVQHDPEVVDMVLQVISQAEKNGKPQEDVQSPMEKNKELAEQSTTSGTIQDYSIEKYMSKFRTIGWGQKFDGRVIKELKKERINIDEDERIVFSKSFGFWNSEYVEYSPYSDLNQKKYADLSVLVGTDRRLIIGSSLAYKGMVSCLDYQDINEVTRQNTDLNICTRQEIIKLVYCEVKAQSVLFDYLVKVCKLSKI